ncbi:MAG: hypothetical protein DMG53_13305 [Acidobacteria bacterium]|nr:MAG: hypothetical protein DMG53_13305 [Acidobacteriota bacterium]
MRALTLFAGCVVLLTGVGANAQTKISGTMQCNKPEPAYSIEVGDRPGHAMLLVKESCAWTGPDIGGEKTKDHSVIGSLEVTATRTAASGIGVATMESGDKTFSTFHGTASVKDGKREDEHGTWSFTGGTGKFKGIKGKGTYKTTANADGTGTVEVEGEYELAQAKATTKK